MKNRRGKNHCILKPDFFLKYKIIRSFDRLCKVSGKDTTITKSEKQTKKPQRSGMRERKANKSRGFDF